MTSVIHSTPPDITGHIAGSYDPSLVTLAIIIAVVASFSALQLSWRISADQKRYRWLIAGAIAMGGGVWTMHFVAMLAHRMPMQVLYDGPLTLASLLVAIFASALGLYISVILTKSWWFWSGGLVMGTGIAAMHYIGMAAMRMKARIEYDPELVLLSIIIVIVASAIALWLGFRSSVAARPRGWSLVVSSVAMGLAISGMHFIGMVAASFIPDTSSPVTTGFAVNATGLASGGGVVVLLSLLILTWLAARRSLAVSSITTRISLLAFSLVMVSTMTIGILFYQHSSQSVIDRELGKLADEVHVEAARIHSLIDTLRNDVLFLSRTPPVEGLARIYQNSVVDPRDGSSEQQWSERLAGIFVSFLESKPGYMQARFISVRDEGSELVRVQRVDSNIVHVSGRLLQTEVDSYYPREATLLDAGKVYLSDIILAREGDRISKPYMPVMQVATPVYLDDEMQGKKLFGVMVIDMNMGPLLDELTEESGEMDFDYVISGSGDLLAVRDPTKEFGFEFNRDWRIQDEYPDLTLFFSDQEQHEISRWVDVPGDELAMHIDKVYFDLENRQRFIGIGEGIPHSAILLQMREAVNRVILVTLVLIVLTTLLSLWWSSKITRPLTEITYAARGFADGDTSIVLPVDAHGELGVLASSFVSMIDEVHERTEQLRQSETFVRTVLDNAADAIITVSNTNETCSILSANCTAARIFSYPASVMVDMDVVKIIPDSRRESKRSFLEEHSHAGIIEGSGIVQAEVNGVRSNGEKFPLEIRITEMLIENEVIFVVLMRDLTEIKKSKAKLLLAARVMDSALEAIVITDCDNNIQSVNPAFSEITGYSYEDVVGQNPRIFGSGRHNDAFYEELWESINKTGCWQGEIWDRRKNGDIFPKWTSISVIKDEAQNIINYVAIFSDISERKVTEERLEQLAHFDILTGLPNRLLFHDRLGQAVAQAHRAGHSLALLFLDLDNFKTINDSMGHDIGDRLLQEVSVRLSRIVRESDTVARLAGDEFTVILHNIHNIDDASHIAANIITALSEPFVLNGQHCSTGVSIGISVLPEDGDDPQTLLKHADVAMYRAKNLGRNNYQFYNKNSGRG